MVERKYYYYYIKNIVNGSYTIGQTASQKMIRAHDNTSANQVSAQEIGCAHCREKRIIEKKRVPRM